MSQPSLAIIKIKEMQWFRVLVVVWWFLIHYFISNYDEKWLRYRKDRSTNIVKYRGLRLNFFFSRLVLYYLESHRAKFQYIPMKNGLEIKERQTD